MKLHLPKQLFTALLTAITLVAAPAWGLSITGSGELEDITLSADTSYYGAKATYVVGNDGYGVLTGVTSGSSGEDITLTFEVDNTVTTNGEALVYINSGDGAKWGVYITRTDDTQTLKGYYVFGNNNGAWGSAVTYNLETGGTTTMTAMIGGSGTYINTGDSVSSTSGGYVYGASGLKHSSKTITNTVLNSKLISTFNTKEYSTLIFSNAAGWSKSYDRSGVNNAVSQAIEIGETGFGNAFDVVAGYHGGVKISSTVEKPVSLSNNMYLAASASADGAALTINNDGDVTFSGSVYLVENATITSSSGAGDISFSGTVTDKKVPTGNDAGTTNGAYTLSLSGTGYNFTGEVDVTGLTMLGGVAASFGNTASLGTLTSSGSDINSINVAGGSVNISALKGAANLAISSSVAGGAFSANVTSGFTGSLDLNHNSAQTSVALSILEGATLKVVADSDNTITSVNLNHGSTLNYWTNHGPHSYTIGEVTAKGDATIAMAPTATWWQGVVNINALNSAVDEDGRALSEKLTLKQNFRNSQRGVFNLNGGAYYGTIDFVGESGSSGNRNHILNIKSGSVAADAVINISGNDNSIMSMAIGDAYVKSVTVRGLTGAGTIYSGEQVYGGGTTLVSDGTTRTLIIDTDGSGRFTNEVTKGVYTSSATLKNGLNLQKDGVGSQTFTGDLSAFNGSITVNQGTLALQSSSAMNNVSSVAVTGGKLEIVNQGGFTLTGSATVSTGAELELGCTSSIGQLTGAGTVSLAKAATLYLSGGTADAVTSHSIGVLNANGGALNLAGYVDLSIGVLNANGGALNLADNAELSIDTLNANGGTLTLADNAELSIDTLNVSHTLNITQGAEVELNITSLNVLQGALLESAGESDIVYIASLDAKEGTASGNGYQAAQGKKILIKGYEWTGTLDNVSYGDGNTYFVSDECTALSSIYYVQQGIVTLGGEQATAGVADATGFNVTKGATLAVAALPSGWSTTDMLTGKVTGDGRLQFASNVTVNHDDAVTTFGGELEVTGSGNVFTVQGNQSNYVNLTSLSNLIINNGAKISYHATPDARTDGDVTPHLQQISVENGTGIFHFEDSDTGNTLYIGEVAIYAGATMKLTSSWQDSPITIQKLTTGGEGAGFSKFEVYSPGGNSQSSGVVNIDSLEGFNGDLLFTKNSGNSLTATVDTGSEGADFNSLTVKNTNGTMGFTFNVEGDTSIGHLSLGSGTVNIRAGKKLSLGGGTDVAQKQHSVVVLAAAENAGVSLGDYATLTLSDVLNSRNNPNSGNTGNNDTVSSLNLTITGGVGSQLHLSLADDATAMNWQSNNTLTLKAHTGEKTVDEVHVSGALAASTFTGSVKTNLGGADLVMKDGSFLVIRSEDAYDFGAKAIKLEGTTTINMYGGITSENTSISNNISGDTLVVGYEKINDKGALVREGGLSLTGALNLTELQIITDTKKSTVLAGDAEKKVQNVTIANDSKLEIAAASELKIVDTQQNTVVSLSSADSTNAASMKATSDNALARMEADASFTIADMTLTNTSITAATADTRVNLKNVSGSAMLGTGTFGLQMKAQAPASTVGNGGSALSLEYGVGGAPSLTLGSGAKLMLSADPSMDAAGTYGTYTLTFNLNVDLSNISVPTLGADWQTLVGFEGWLGEMLVDQNAIYVDVTEGVVAQSTAPTVSYGYSAGSGSNVGTLVITINGLNVPEPTTATLSLLALAALAARRRRK